MQYIHQWRCGLGWISLALGALAACLGAAPASAQQTPFVAYIASDGCAIRSGPGARFYETGELDGGQEVIVHRRAPGGWLGVKPPTSSFCWVPNDDLRVDQDGHTAEVVRDGVVAWIAPSDGKAPNRWQVRLHIGERVTVKGAPERMPLLGQAPRWWRRISPPSGEFRWIREIDLAEPPGRIEVEAKPTANKLKIQSVSHSQKTTTVGDDRTAKRESSQHAPPNNATGEPKRFQPNAKIGALGEKPATASRQADASSEGIEPNSPVDADQAIDRLEIAARRLEAAFQRLDEVVQPAQHATWKRRRGANEASPKDASTAEPREVRFRDRHAIDKSPQLQAPRELDADDEPAKRVIRQLDEVEFKEELVRLDADLSLMVSKPVKRWRFESLKERALMLAESGPTALERGQAALLLDSIHGFDQLHVRRLAAERQSAIDRKRHVATDGDDREEQTRPKRGSLDVSAMEVLDDGPTDYRRPTGSGLRRPASDDAQNDMNNDAENDVDDDALESDRTANRDIRYDAEGILRLVRSKTKIAPPYALMDDQGDIVTLVSPAPGLNLRSYVGKRIGVFGPQRELPSFRRRLLTAERVVQMDRLR